MGWLANMLNRLNRAFGKRSTERDEIGGLNCYKWLFRGVDLRKKGRDEEALDCFDTALRIDPKFDLAWEAKQRVLSD